VPEIVLSLIYLLGPAAANAKVRAVQAPIIENAFIPPEYWPWIVFGSLLLTWYYVFRRQ
jgi:hypothetical protein